MAAVRLGEEREAKYTRAEYLERLWEWGYQGGREIDQVGTSLVVEGRRAYQAEED